MYTYVPPRVDYGRWTTSPFTLMDLHIHHRLHGYTYLFGALLEVYAACDASLVQAQPPLSVVLLNTTRRGISVRMRSKLSGGERWHALSLTVVSSGDTAHVLTLHSTDRTDKNRRGPPEPFFSQVLSIHIMIRGGM